MRDMQVEFERFEQLEKFLWSIEDNFLNADFTDTLAEMVSVLEQGETKAFDDECTPGGEAWDELAWMTISRKGHAVALYETGALRDSLTGDGSQGIREVASRELTFGTSVPYAIFHQEDDNILPPQREHTGMSEQTCQTVVDAVADAAVDALMK